MNNRLDSAIDFESYFQREVSKCSKVILNNVEPRGGIFFDAENSLGY